MLRILTWLFAGMFLLVVATESAWLADLVTDDCCATVCCDRSPCGMCSQTLLATNEATVLDCHRLAVPATLAIFIEPASPDLARTTPPPRV